MRRQDSNLRPPGYEAVSSTNRSHFGSDLCFLPPFARRIFRCFRPSLPAFFGFWVKTGSEALYERFAKRKSPPQVFHIRATPISYFGTIYISVRGCIINLKSFQKRYRQGDASPCPVGFPYGTIPLWCKGGTRLQDNIIVKPSVEKQFDRFLRQGRELVFSAP